MWTVKRRLKSILLSTPGFQRLCRLLTRKHVRVIMYHRFVFEHDVDPRFLDLASLRRQMYYITRHHVTWTPDIQLAALQGKRWPGGSCPVIITVDDGYHDFFEIAYPVLKEFKVPAMLFVVTGFVDGQIWFWWDRLEYILNRTSSTILEFTLTGQARTIDLSTYSLRRVAWHILADCLCLIPNTDKESALEDLAKRLAVEVPSTPPKRYRSVTWDQIRIMEESGLLIGCHTVTHPILSRIDQKQAYTEIASARDRLLKQTTVKANWFCYPQGGPADFTPEIKQIVQELGFEGAYIAFQSQYWSQDRFTLPRYSAPRDDTEFQWMLCGAAHLIMGFRRILAFKSEFGKTDEGRLPSFTTLNVTVGPIK